MAYTPNDESIFNFLLESSEGDTYDYKNKVLHKDEGNEKTAFLIHGYVFNINEAGNVLWGATAAKLGMNEFLTKKGVHGFTIFDENSLDEPGEQFSISVGYEAWKQNKDIFKK